MPYYSEGLVRLIYSELKRVMEDRAVKANNPNINF